MFLSEKTPLVAIDIGTHSIKMARMKRTGRKFELLNFSLMPLEENCIVDGAIKQPDEISDTLARMISLEKAGANYAVASIASEAVIVKKIRVPRMTEAEVAQNIEKEAEQYIPFDIDDVMIDFQLLETAGDRSAGGADAGTMEILLVAVQKGLVEDVTEVLYNAGLKPAIIDLDVFAMANACELGVNLKNEGVVALIDLGESYTHLNILQNGSIAYTRDIPLGGGYCTKKLMSRFQLPYRDSMELKLGVIPDRVKSDEVIAVLVESLQKILDEVQKAFEFFGSTSNSQVGRVFLTGGGALINGAESMFAHYLNAKVEILNPMKGIKVNQRKFDRKTIETLGPLSTVAVGLAARRFDYQ